MILLLFLGALSNVSMTAERTDRFLLEDGLAVYRPNNIMWTNINDNNTSKFWKRLETNTLSITTIPCKYRQVPLRVVYKNSQNAGGLGGYYVFNGEIQSQIDLRVFNTEAAIDGVTTSTFDHLEIDSIFLPCIDTLKQQSDSHALSVFRPTQLEDRPINLTIQDFFSPLAGGKPFLFSSQYQEGFTLLPDKKTYHIRALITPSLRISNLEELQKSCDGSAHTTVFEQQILGRTMPCGVTRQLASSENYRLKRGAVLQLSGKVAIGAAYYTIVRVGGGIVKIRNLTRGIVQDEFHAPVDGLYNISLSQNMFVYNYPLLDLTISLTEFISK